MASQRTSLAKSVVLSLLITVIVLGWLAFREGIFDSPKALDEQAAALEAGALERWPFADAGLEDAGVQDAGVQDAGLEDAGAPDGGLAKEDDATGPSLGLDGVARLSASKLSIDDKQKRNALRVRHVRASIRLRAMQRAPFAFPTDASRASTSLCIANALRAAQPAVPPEEQPDSGEWLIEAGPITLKDVVLTLGFTANPVQFRVDRGTLRVRRGPAAAGPVIYFDQIEGALLKPRPLPRPIRIAYAKGLVRLKGRPLVEMVARTCLGISELRIRAIVPARRQPVRLTATSIGVSSLLGRAVLQTVGEIKSDKVDYEWGAVKLEGGRNCLQPPTQDTDAPTR